MTKRQMVMAKASIAEAAMSFMARPPLATGLSRELAMVAPSGRVRMNAAQNSRVRETVV